MIRPSTTGLTLDTGALLAFDDPSKALQMQARLDVNARRGGTLCIPATVVAQAWRSARQARLARILKAPEIDVPVMTLSAARAVGEVCAAGGYSDIVDVHVVLCARARGHAIATSDPRDIGAIDPEIPVIRV